MTPENITLMFGWYMALVIALTVHEAAHATTAFWLGDPTAYEGGQVTLNPLVHIQREPFGTVIVPILSFLLTGWMYGWASAPYNPHWAIAHPRRAAIMSLAGPASNFLLAAIAGAILCIGLRVGWFEPAKGFPELREVVLHEVVVSNQEGWTVGAAKLFSIMLSLNLLLGIFNLMPVPPLDGSCLWQLLLSRESAAWILNLSSMPAGWMISIFIASGLTGKIYWPAWDWCRETIKSVAAL
jgi:Zn-dependent protease